MITLCVWPLIPRNVAVVKKTHLMGTIAQMTQKTSTVPYAFFLHISNACVTGNSNEAFEEGI